MSAPKAILWQGRDPQNKQAELTVTKQGVGLYIAVWEKGYDGADDSRCICGVGETPEKAIGDYWERWEEKYS